MSNSKTLLGSGAREVDTPVRMVSLNLRMVSTNLFHAWFALGLDAELLRLADEMVDSVQDLPIQNLNFQAYRTATQDLP